MPPARLVRPAVLFNVPVVFFAGDRDAVTPVAWTTKVAAGFPNSRLLTIPKLGHFPDGLEHMECFDAVMNDFFRAWKGMHLDDGSSCFRDVRYGTQAIDWTFAPNGGCGQGGGRHAVNLNECPQIRASLAQRCHPPCQRRQSLVCSRAPGLANARWIQHLT